MRIAIKKFFWKILGSQRIWERQSLSSRLYTICKLIPQCSELIPHLEGSILTNDQQRLNLAHNALWRVANDLQKMDDLKRLATEAESESESEPVKIF